MTILKKKIDANQYNLKDQVVSINRVTKVVKAARTCRSPRWWWWATRRRGGRPRFRQSEEVPQAIRKGIEAAKKNLIRVHLTETTIPHLVLGRYGAGQVLLKPAPEGTGVIAGGAVRAVMTSVGCRTYSPRAWVRPTPTTSSRPPSTP